MNPRDIGIKSSNGPGMLSSLLVTSMVTTAFVGTLFFGWRVAGLPFVPFDVFDWLTRALPGRLIAFGIGLMVSVIRALHLGPTSETAKMAEQLMALAALFIPAVVGGTILFITLRVRPTNGVSQGLVLGCLLGVPAMLVSLHRSGTASVGSGKGSVWILGAFLA